MKLGEIIEGVQAKPNWLGPSRALVLPFIPVVSAILLVAIHRQQQTGDVGWGAFAIQLAVVLVSSIPLIVGHALALRLPPIPSLIGWLVLFGAYPIVGAQIGHSVLLGQQEWLIVALLSGVSLLVQRSDQAPMLAWLRHIPVTLDGAVLALLSLWALAASLLFIGTPDPVNNQPLRIWFNGDRIAHHPWLFAGYLLQFSIIAALVYGYYWSCRHLLVRRALRTGGWVGFLTSSLGLWLIYTPIACGIVLLLPLNTKEWALIPSEVPNPFHPDNFRFAAALWVVICPIVLASERLVAMANTAIGRHERARAELQLLQQQINPHFLFNTLNTLYALCLKDNAASAQAIVKLSDLLRYSVYQTQDDWVGLDGEVDHLRNYLDLQSLRFGAQCKVKARWPDDAQRYQVPPQMLIMLVENAFKHGVERCDRPSTIELQIGLSGNRLEFACTNTPLPDLPATPASGLGLANLRRRLELIYGDDFVLESGAKGQAWVARLLIGARSC